MSTFSLLFGEYSGVKSGSVHNSLPFSNPESSTLIPVAIRSLSYDEDSGIIAGGAAAYKGGGRRTILG